MSIQSFPSLSVFPREWRAWRDVQKDGTTVLHFETNQGSIAIFFGPEDCPPPNWWPEQDERPLPDEPVTASEAEPEGAV
jgi:hypothetical protein